MTQRDTALELEALAASLLHPSALTELALVFACLGLAWLFVRQLKGTQVRASSVLFGDRVFDGVLFPVFALSLALAARALLPLLGVPSAVFRVAIPVLVSLLVIRFTVRVLRAAFPASNAIRAIERTVSWLAWIGVVAWVTGVLPMVMEALDEIRWTFGTTKISARNVVEGTLSAIVVLVLALWLSAAIEGQLLKGATTANMSLRKIAANMARALLLFVGLLFALSAAGIDLTALGVLGGALGVGLGFGLQKIAANYVSGFVILAERSLRIGDMVKVDTFEGPHHRHPHALHRDPLAGRARGHRAERAAHHAAGGELVARRPARGGHEHRAGRLRQRRPPPAGQARGGDARRAARAGRARAGGAALRVRRRRDGAHAQLLDRRSGERAGQREVGGQLRGAGRARGRRRGDPVPAARGQGHRLPAATGASCFRCANSAFASVSFNSRSELNGITALTAVPSGRLPVRSIAVNCPTPA
jgi:small-conductance mechanosensitive channel